MAPTDMEALVTFPVEAALNGASGVRRVRSSTAVGIAVVWVDFDWGADVLRARQTVSERLAAVAGTLPDGIDAPGDGAAVVDHGRDHVRRPAVRHAHAAGAAHDGGNGGPPAGAGDAGRRAGDGHRRRAAAVRGAGRTRSGWRTYGIPLGAVEDAMRRASRNTSAGFRRAGGQE